MKNKNNDGKTFCEIEKMIEEDKTQIEEYKNGKKQRFSL